MYSPAISRPRDGVSRPSSKSEARKDTCPRSEFGVMCSVTTRISGVRPSGGAAHTTVASTATSAVARSALLFIVEFIEPGHLNRLQLGLVGFLGIVVEFVQLGDPFVQVRKA